MIRLFTGLSLGGLALLFQHTIGIMSLSVSENSHVKLLWDSMFIQIMYCQLGVLILCMVVNKEVGSVQIIDVAVPADCIVSSKEAEKVKKYSDLSIELNIIVENEM